MHILLVAPLPPPLGGVATHAQDLQCAMRKIGKRATIVDPRRRGPDGQNGQLGLAWALARAALQGDLVHVHTNGHNRKSWLLAALCAGGRLSRRSLLLTLHSGLAPVFIRRQPALIRRVCRRYSQLVVVSREIATALCEAGVDPETLSVVPAFSASMLPLPLEPPGFASVRERHPLLLSSMLAPGEEYGADVLLDAFQLVHHHHGDAGLVIYGPETRTPALAHEVASRGLFGAVHLFGALDRGRSLAVIRGSDLFVRPTRADGDSVSVREALALGRHVVASRVGARPAGVHLFEAGSASACAETIFHVLGKSPVESPGEIEDCIPPLLALYRRCGLPVAATTGTALVTTSA